jgi:predicted Zn-dependent protease
VTSVPPSLQRRALEVQGWLELDCPEAALDRVDSLVANPAARLIGLRLRAETLVRLGRYVDALADLDAVRPHETDLEWLDLREAWCRKRLDDLPGAISCMERLLGRSHRSAIGHYNLACYLALLGDIDRALDAVTVACGIEPSFRTQARDDEDLRPLRGHPAFEELVAGAEE